MEELKEEILKKLEEYGLPVEPFRLEELARSDADLFVALEALLREGKAARFLRVRPASHGVNIQEFWTTKKIADKCSTWWGDER